MTGGSEPFEHHHLGGDDLGAVRPPSGPAPRPGSRSGASPPRRGPRRRGARPPGARAPSAARRYAPRSRSPRVPVLRAAGRGSPAPCAAPKLIFGKAAPGSGARSGTVGPRPPAFCSVTRTGTSRSRAAAARRPVLAMTPAPRRRSPASAGPGRRRRGEARGRDRSAASASGTCGMCPSGTVSPILASSARVGTTRAGMTGPRPDRTAPYPGPDGIASGRPLQRRVAPRVQATTCDPLRRLVRGWHAAAPGVSAPAPPSAVLEPNRWRTGAPPPPAPS